MSQNAAKLARIGLQWSLGLVLIYECSRMLFYSGAHAAASAHIPHFLLLAIAAVELLGAILFLLPPTMDAGGKILIGTFLVAAVIHILHGQPDVGYLVIYGMAALTIIAE